MSRLFAALVCLLAPAAAPAQGIFITVPGGRETAIAVPAPQLPGGDPQGGAAEAHETLIRDLDLSGYFTVIDPKATIERGKGVEPGTFSMDDWSILKADVLVKTRWLPPGDSGCDPSGKKACLDAFIYYVVDGQKLASRRFRSEPTNSRHLAHDAAAFVVRTVTGREALFGARLAAIGAQTGNKEVYLLDLDGKGVAPVTRNGSINLSPAWSPDSRSLAWTSYKKDNPDLYVKDLGTGRTRVVSNVKGVNTSPAFDPTGTKLALARTSGADTDLYVVDAKTGAQLQQVTKGGGIDVAPHFSPVDGNLLAFASERSGGSQIYVANLASGEINRVTFNGDFNTDPVFSPDGTRIAFVGRRPTGFDIFVVDRDGRNLTPITQDTGDNEDPAWSPDGLYLVFSSTRTGRSELWLSTADGRHHAQVTKTGGWTQPSFAPVERR